jgi:hypothetical protein
MFGNNSASFFVKGAIEFLSLILKEVWHDYQYEGPLFKGKNALITGGIRDWQRCTYGS